MYSLNYFPSFDSSPFLFFFPFFNEPTAANEKEEGGENGLRLESRRELIEREIANRRFAQVEAS